MKNKEFLTSHFIAHRGIHHKFLENTIPAFSYAIKEKMAIELDVRLSKDCVVVVFHDSTLKRIFEIDWKIEDLMIKEIQKYQYIPTLKEVLDL